MAISLYDLSVASYLQTLDAMSGFLEKAKAHFQEQGVDLATIVDMSLFPDMRPFRFQVQQVAFHSVKALEAVEAGIIKVGPRELPQHDYEGLQALVVDARQALRKLTPEAVNAHEGAEMVLEARGTQRVFTAEGFVMSFALPNFYFHATTAYDILRAAGAPVGKLDFMGALRLKV
ncbi:MAG TPA: DUF1993 domain-containing protein [Caulobacteraceae bacterium]|nr:DUF1993 domain-containing protein [Caulobacteraceae bacterium]